MTPELELDPDGRPLTVIDLQGDPRDLTVWGAVMAGPAVALIATDHEDPPTSGEAMALADALNPERVALLVEARGEAETLRRALREQVDRTLGYIEQLAETRQQLGQARRELDQLPGLRAQVEALRGEVEAARGAGRDVARLAVIALTRTLKPSRYIRRTP